MWVSSLKLASVNIFFFNIYSDAFEGDDAAKYVSIPSLTVKKSLV